VALTICATSHADMGDRLFYDDESSSTIKKRKDDRILSNKVKFATYITIVDLSK